METGKLYKWITSLLEERKTIDEGFLRKNIDVEDLNHILFILNYFVSKGYLKAEVVGNDTRYILQDAGGIKEVIGAFPAAGEQESIKEIQNSLVVSVPPSLADVFETVRSKHKVQIMLLQDTIRALLSVAESEVLIASPFIEWDGMVYISDDISRIAKKGVSLKLITRDVIDPKKNDYSYVSKLKAISKLHNLYESNRTRPDRTFSMRDFGSQITALSGTSLHYEGIHQKMIVVDRKYAYVGSGEIRGASLMTNGEAGYLIHGDQAAFWADFFDMFWKAGKDIPREYLKY